ncbi:hypothetical protein ACFL35_17435, partial [Candidatus Riflebacteria bacterium]
HLLKEYIMKSEQEKLVKVKITNASDLMGFLIESKEYKDVERVPNKFGQQDCYDDVIWSFQKNDKEYWGKVFFRSEKSIEVSLFNLASPQFFKFLRKTFKDIQVKSHCSYISYYYQESLDLKLPIKGNELVEGIMILLNGDSNRSMENWEERSREAFKRTAG